MIRLPPSAIALGTSDLRDFEIRRRRRWAMDRAKYRAMAEDQATDHSGDTLSQVNINDDCYGSREAADQKSKTTHPTDLEYFSGSISSGELQSPLSNLDSRGSDEGSSVEFAPTDAPSSTVSPVHENAFFEIQPPSPSKSEFQQSGSADNLTLPTSRNNAQYFSPFVPGDMSTSPQLQTNAGPVVRTRPLPRSPLFRAQNVSSSPETHPTMSLSSRIVSQVVTHNTPGIMFSRPPRRSHYFRHQTNSFSFDESERSGAAYEQDRASSTSTTGSRPRPPEDLNLHDELRRSTTHYSASDRSPSPAAEANQGDEALDTSSRFGDLTSPQLPPPFSTASRGSSRAESLPAYSVSDSASIGNPRTSPMCPISSSPSQTSTPRALTPQVSPHTGFLRSFARAARILSSHRARSPILTGNLADQPQTPSRDYQVYNDRLPPHAQPQTPAHLPEARHQSRFHPSYTAPVERALARYQRYSNSHGDGAVDSVNPTQSHEAFPEITTPSRRSRRRYDIPLGMSERGFQGLYGGQENGDDEESWFNSIRFNNAGVRLWGVRDAGTDGQELRVTPEREDWRASRQ
ncbi:hypothetical protein B0O99DRAFT_589419 [Bisporella sp. PMI_857]|nr:hypothetical protein B0O99DRAFT_589419 [Bisporella sp. PMI_857]